MSDSIKRLFTYSYTNRARRCAECLTIVLVVGAARASFKHGVVSDKGQAADANRSVALEDLVHSISNRAGRCMERLGLLEQDAESAWLELEPADDTDALPHISKALAVTRSHIDGPQGVAQLLQINPSTST